MLDLSRAEMLEELTELNRPLGTIELVATLCYDKEIPAEYIVKLTSYIRARERVARRAGVISCIKLLETDVRSPRAMKTNYIPEWFRYARQIAARLRVKVSYGD